MLNKKLIGLVERYFDKGHHIYTDSYYTCIELIDYLAKRNTGYVGIVRNNREKVKGLEDGMRPEEEIANKEVKVLTAEANKSIWRYYRNKIEKYERSEEELVLTVWWDFNMIKFLSNCIPVKNTYAMILNQEEKHRSNKKNREKEYKPVPNAVKYYSKHAYGVDIANQLSTSFRHLHKVNTWWHNIFIHYFIVTLNNCYIIYKDQKIKNKIFTFMNRKEFIFVIIRKLLYASGTPAIKDIDYLLATNEKSQHEYKYSILNHSIKQVSNKSFNSNYMYKKFHGSYNNIKGKCSVCPRKTRYCCHECDSNNNVMFCIECFETHHKKLFGANDKNDDEY